MNGHGQAQPSGVDTLPEYPSNREEGPPALPSRLPATSARPKTDPSFAHESQKSIRRIMQDERSVALELLMTVGSKLGAKLFYFPQTGSQGWLCDIQPGSPLHSALGNEFRDSGVVLLAMDGIQVSNLADFRKMIASVRTGDQYRLSLVCGDGVDLTGVDLSRLAKPPCRRNGETYPLLDPKNDTTSLRSKRPASIETGQIRSKKPRIEDCKPPSTSRSPLQTMEQGTSREEASLEPDGPLVRGEGHQSNVLAAVPLQDAFNPRTPEPQTASQDSENRPPLSMEMQPGILTKESVSNTVEKPNELTTTFLLPWKLENFGGLEVLSRDRFERDFMTVFRRKLTHKLRCELRTFDLQIGYSHEKPFFMEFQASGNRKLVSSFRKRALAWASYVEKMDKLDSILKDPDSIVVDITAQSGDCIGIQFLHANKKNIRSDHIVEVRGAVFVEVSSLKSVVVKLLGPEAFRAAAAVIAVNGNSSFSSSKNVGILFARRRKEKKSIVITICFHKGTPLLNPQDHPLTFQRLGETKFFANWNKVGSDVGQESSAMPTLSVETIEEMQEAVGQADDTVMEYPPPDVVASSAIPKLPLETIEEMQEADGQADDTVMEYPPPDFVASSAIPKLPLETIEEMEELVTKILNDPKSVEVEFYMPSTDGIGALIDKKARYLHALRQGGQLATVFGKKPADWFMAILSVNGVSIRDIDHFIAEKAKPSNQDMFKLRVACFDGIDLSDVDRSRLVGAPRRRNGEKYPMHLHPKNNTMDAPIARKPKLVLAPNTEQQNYFEEIDGTSSSQLNHVPDIIPEEEKRKAPVSRTETSDALALAQVNSQSEPFEHPVQNIKMTKIPGGENRQRVSLSIKRRLKQFRNHAIFDEKTFEAEFMDDFRATIKKKFPLIFPSFTYSAKIPFNPNWFEVTAQADPRIIDSLTHRIKIWGWTAAKMAMVNLILHDPQSILVDVEVPPGLTGIGSIEKDKLQYLSGEPLRLAFGLGIDFTPSKKTDAKKHYGGVSFEITNPSGLIAQKLGEDVCNPVAAIIAGGDLPLNQPAAVKKFLRLRRDQQSPTVLTICLFRGSGARLFQNPELNARRLGGTPFYRSFQTFSITGQNHTDAFLAKESVLNNPRTSPAMNYSKDANSVS